MTFFEIKYHKMPVCVVPGVGTMLLVSGVLLVFVSLCSVLARKTPLRKPNCGEGLVSIKPRQKSVYDFVGLLCWFII